MPLQQLVDHFNDRFAQEHGFDFRPFILQGGAVSGLYGKNRLNSMLTPVRDATNPQLIAGHAAQIITVPNFFHRQQTLETENLLSCEPGQQSIKFSSIINFDRLCRTVHLLNSLAVSHADSVLLLEVDPRHIIGVKHDHGAYFEEIIVYCGLETKNVVISLAASGVHEAHHDKLLKGLNNYRECGYKVALNVGHFVSADRGLDLIKRLAPDYISVTAPNETYTSLDVNSTLITALRYLKELLASLGGKIIMQDVKQPEQGLCAIQVGADLVQGDYYEKLPDFNIGQVKHKHDAKNFNYID